MSHTSPHHPIPHAAGRVAGPHPSRIRWELVASVRRQLAAGTYPLEAAWERTLERLAASLDSPGKGAP